MRLPDEQLHRCWFLAGPTACGKTEAGVELALQLGAEIVSMDSMSVYRGMDVGTAKPSARLQRLVPHHLVDVADFHQEFSLADYLLAAERAVGGIVARGRVPLFVGGTGLYLRSLLRGVFEGPGADPQLRRELEAGPDRLPAVELHERLRRVDPQSAEKIHPHDVRRVIRALEVHALTGRPLSELARQGARPPEERPQNVFWLRPPRAWLYGRIDERVRAMFAAGLVEEVRRLLASGKPFSSTARQAVGYREIVDALEAGISPSEVLPRVQTRTRQFAKRQHTWFRHLHECRPVDMTGEESPAQLADLVLAASAADGIQRHPGRRP
jgi:tRNA dimethylallyltransferase